MDAPERKCSFCPSTSNVTYVKDGKDCCKVCFYNPFAAPREISLPFFCFLCGKQPATYHAGSKLTLCEEHMFRETDARADLSVAQKADSQKVRLDLLPFEALEEIAKVLTKGAEKYEDHNWRKGFTYSRLIGAALRHLFSFARGEDKDPEWGYSHLAHAGCCILFLLSHEINKCGTDDRVKTK